MENAVGRGGGWGGRHGDGVAEGKREGESMSEQGILQAKQRPQTGSPRAGFFCGLVSFGPHSVFLKMELSVFTWKTHSFLYHHPYRSSFSSLACLNTFMDLPCSLKTQKNQWKRVLELISKFTIRNKSVRSEIIKTNNIFPYILASSLKLYYKTDPIQRSSKTIKYLCKNLCNR